MDPASQQTKFQGTCSHQKDSGQERRKAHNRAGVRAQTALCLDIAHAVGPTEADLLPRPALAQNCEQVTGCEADHEAATTDPGYLGTHFPQRSNGFTQPDGYGCQAATRRHPFCIFNLRQSPIVCTGNVAVTPRNGVQYSSWRRIHACFHSRPSSFRPFGATSRKW